MTIEDTPSRSRRASHASFAGNVPPSTQRAQGMPGAWRARSLVCKIKKHTSIVTTVTPETPGIPRATVLTAYIALSPVTGLSCHRRPRSCLHRLDASVGASGPHDFAVRRSAPSSEAPPASTASRPAFVTIASRPSKGTGPDRYNAVSTWASSGISEIPKLG
jgi:hypothetical protein